MNYLDKMSVKARITSLFIVFLVFFALFGLFSLQKIGVIGGLIRTMYDHPLQVSDASMRAMTGVLRMHRGMKDLSMATTQMGVNVAIQTVQAEEKNVYHDLKIVKKMILGAEGRKMIRQTIEMFAGWKPIRDEVAELVLKGDKEAGGAITRKRGADYVIKLERQMEELNDYAHAKAGGFMSDADDIRQWATRMVIFSFCTVSIVCFSFSLIVINSIVKSLKLLKSKMAIITSTKDMIPVDMPGKSEITELALHFNLLIGEMTDQFWLRNNINKLNHELGGDVNFDEMTDKCINMISRNVNACAGAFYLADKEKTCKLTASFAFVDISHFASSFSLGEGVVGQVAKENKPILLENIPREDTSANTVAVSERLNSIYAVPILYNKELLAVLEIASFEPMVGIKKQFVDEAAGTIAALLNNALQIKKINDLFDKSQAANDALQVKSSEINAQNEELNAINKELQVQRDEIQAQASELEVKRVLVEEADRLKSEFLSNMSHELRTPLNSIMSLSQLMISKGVDKDPAKAVEYLNVIDRNGRQLLNLINDILDLTKIESGNMDIYPTKFEVKQLVCRVMETVQPLAEKKKLRFEINVKDAPFIFSDEEKIYQILLNCCSNAIKFTDHGTISLNVTEIDGTMKFAVKDTGIGIAPGELESIFDQFRQLDGSFTRVHDGTGLGLAISRKLALLLGGEIKAESVPGSGSIFSLRLPSNLVRFKKQGEVGAEGCQKNNLQLTQNQIPVSEDTDIFSEQTTAVLTDNGFDIAVPKDGVEDLPHVKQEMPVEKAPGIHKSNIRSIVLVEDNPDNRLTIQAILEDECVKMFVAADGKQGVDLVKEKVPDLVLMDIQLPIMSGIEAINVISADPLTSSIPIIAVSARAMKGDRDSIMAAGADDYVAKPINPAELQQKVKKWLS